MANPKKAVAKKVKKWFMVHAPQLFGGEELGEIIAEEPEKLINRVLRLSLGDLTGKMGPTSAYTFVGIRIKEVNGIACMTQLVGHEMSPVYLSTIIRRRRSILDLVRDVTTADGVKLRVKLLLISVSKLSGKQANALRRALADALAEEAKKESFDKFIQEILFGRMSTKLFNSLKKIAPLRRIEVRKTEMAEVFKK